MAVNLPHLDLDRLVRISLAHDGCSGDRYTLSLQLCDKQCNRSGLKSKSYG
jgi:hypothetical protein